MYKCVYACMCVCLCMFVCVCVCVCKCGCKIFKVVVVFFIKTGVFKNDDRCKATHLVIQSIRTYLQTEKHCGSGVQIFF